MEDCRGPNRAYKANAPETEVRGCYQVFRAMERWSVGGSVSGVKLMLVSFGSVNRAACDALAATASIAAFPCHVRCVSVDRDSEAKVSTWRKSRMLLPCKYKAVRKRRLEHGARDQCSRRAPAGGFAWDPGAATPARKLGLRSSCDRSRLPRLGIAVSDGCC